MTTPTQTQELERLRAEVSLLKGQLEDFVSAAKAAIPPGEHPAFPTMENWAWQMRNLGSDRRAVYAQLADLKASLRSYRVYIAPMVESYRITYLVIIDSSDRPKNASPMDSVGRITPFYSENFSHAELEGEAWAEFLGITLEPFVKPAWLDARIAELKMKQLGGSPASVGGTIGHRVDVTC